MKNIFNDLKTYSKHFRKYFWRYLLLFIGLELFNLIVIIPVFRALATVTLQASAVPFISYQNILTIISTHSLVAIALIIELLVLMLIIYVQFSFLMIASSNITEKFSSMLQQTWGAIKRIRLGSLLILIAYFLLIIPFADLVFRTPLLAKIQIPEFILDYMMRKPAFLISLLIIYALIIILGVRLLLTLPLMVFKKQSSWKAMKESWALTTKKQWWPLVSRLVIVSLISFLGLSIYDGILVLFQFIFDTIAKNLGHFFIQLNLLLVQIGSVIVLTWASVLSILIILKPLSLQNKKKASVKTKCKFWLISAVVYVVAVGGALLDNNFYLDQTKLNHPLVISHRGVSAKNGVQNTIAALKKTSKLHPDYVEIDVHETKDNKFVVMHDENLKQLAGINKRPKDLTLKQLNKIMLKEDGHRARIASLDSYLKVANKLHQKLLIEIKTTPSDSKAMLQRFNHRYGQLIINRHYQLQSLDYSVIERLHRLNPRLFVLYIQPYNFTYPSNLAAGYSMEYSTLNNDFIWQSHLQRKPVYAWTVNTSGAMKQMMFIGVDGIITDNVKLLQQNIKSFKANNSPVNQLLNYIIVLPNPFSN
ncbi:glycerophosphodiester phosphodiesterase [Lactobacillus rodentium]|uniref:Glycerophosphodiester phosphodiesterase n=1 Tax=Lactobacillus rodentium TaxID=947835 RepID=A0A2Z6TG94_9LACO|nr:glycerophosphodiester phosphodiesterase [Lactobacillus rodentium]MCR1895035.1 glycerophosphodiester phosphodiesterase [Lactobacillus rodentium]GBG05350.1 glycerophosphodiester phosphodiesterase [Lactobacillus rodentium]